MNLVKPRTTPPWDQQHISPSCMAPVSQRATDSGQSFFAPDAVRVTEAGEHTHKKKTSGKQPPEWKVRKFSSPQSWLFSSNSDRHIGASSFILHGASEPSIIYKISQHKIRFNERERSGKKCTRLKYTSEGRRRWRLWGSRRGAAVLARGCTLAGDSRDQD